MNKPFAVSIIGCLCMALLAGSAMADDAKPAPPPAEKGDATASAEVKVGTGVEKHEIVGEASSFAPGTTVWVWSKVNNAGDSIKHVWKKDGKEVWTATLAIGGKSWSTMSRRALPTAGSYEVEVTAADGTSLGKVAFDVK